MSVKTIKNKNITKTNLKWVFDRPKGIQYDACVHNVDVNIRWRGATVNFSHYVGNVAGR